MTKSFTFQKIVFIRKKLKLETFNSKPRNFSDPGWKFLSAVVACELCLPKKCHETPLQHCNKSYISYLAQERTFSTVCFPLLHNCRHKSVVVLCARAAFGGGEVFTTLFVEDYNLEVSSNKTLARSFWWKCAYGNFSVCLFFGLAGWWLAALMGLRVLQTSFETKVFFPEWAPLQLSQPPSNYQNYYQTPLKLKVFFSTKSRGIWRVSFEQQQVLFLIISRIHLLICSLFLCSDFKYYP